MFQGRQLVCEGGVYYTVFMLFVHISINPFGSFAGGLGEGGGGVWVRGCRDYQISTASRVLLCKREQSISL